MSDFFSYSKPVFTASAPGRMDVMGGIADYSGALLLQLPIAAITTVSIQERDDDLFYCRTQLSSSKRYDYQISCEKIANRSYAEAGRIIKEQEGGDWAAYLLGCFIVLQQEKNLPLSGANILVRSAVPWGKGVSSSAALEVAAMSAINEMYQLALNEIELPLLAQQVENQVVGAPCGLMDQLAVYLGQKNKLLPLICQPHTVFDPIVIPRGVGFCGIDSGIRHAVSGTSYSDVRTSAFMAYSLIAQAEGASVQDLELAKRTNDYAHLPYNGYLSNIPVSVFESSFKKILPNSITGKDFLERAGCSIDNATVIDPAKTYYPLPCGRHPVYENFRVKQFLLGLQAFAKHPDKTGLLTSLGELMLQSHSSYSAVGLGNRYTDELVNMVLEKGPSAGVFGARVSGGGNGGTVCVLYAGKEGKQTLKEIYLCYKKKSGKNVFFFSGSCNGAFYLNKQENYMS
jgi:L-arabinokinase